jgi:hypothetical protein
VVLPKISDLDIMACVWSVNGLVSLYWEGKSGFVFRIDCSF